MDADALLHPRGPLPPAVYWRRRAITAAAVTLVLFVLLRACGDDDANLTADSGKSTSTPSPSANRPTPTSAATAAVPRPAATTTSPSPARVAGAPCQDADLVISATANAKEYAAGVRPLLTLVVTNRGPVSCTRDLGAALRELRVVSGSDRIWSSDDCAPGGAAEVTTLPAGGSKSFPVTWSRRRSRPGCPAGREPVAPGTYRVLARLGSIERPGDVFSLRG